MIVYESGFVTALLNHSSASEKIAKLHALFDLLKSFIERQKNYTLGDFFAYLDLMEEHEIAIRGTRHCATARSRALNDRAWLEGFGVRSCFYHECGRSHMGLAHAQGIDQVTDEDLSRCGYERRGGWG